MNLDWTNILATLFATFVGGVAGSYFASRATQKQTKTQVELQLTQSAAHRELEISLQLKERAFELLQIVDEFVAYSYQKEAPIHRAERDVISRKLITLCGVLLKEDVAQVKAYVWEIRNLHVNKECKYSFKDADIFFDKLSKKINQTYFK